MAAGWPAEADIGTVIMWGLVGSVVSFAVCYFALAPIYARGVHRAAGGITPRELRAVDDGASVEKASDCRGKCTRRGHVLHPAAASGRDDAVGSIGKADGGGSCSGAYVFFDTFGDTVLSVLRHQALGLMVLGRKRTRW